MVSVGCAAARPTKSAEPPRNSFPITRMHHLRRANDLEHTLNPLQHACVAA